MIQYTLNKLIKVIFCVNFIVIGLSSAAKISAAGVTHDTWSLPGTNSKQVSATVSNTKMYPFWSPPTGTEADEVPPNTSITASDFDITLPGGFDQYHGERVHGYLVPEVSGVHKFFVSGNKDVEFFINYDENGNGSPTNARDYAELTKVAEMVRGSDPDTMNYRYTSNDYDWYRWGQAPLKDVYLTAGQTYYIAAITKSVCCRTPHNKFQVAWQEPAGGAQSAAPVSGSSSNVIPSSVLIEYAVIDEKPIINLNSEDPLNHEVGIEYVDAATCTDDIDPTCGVTVTDWGGMSWSNPQEGSYSLTLTTSADSGGNIAERVRTVIVLPAPPVNTGGITHDTWSLPGTNSKQVSATVSNTKMYPFWSPPTGTEADEVPPNTSITASDFDITLPGGFDQYHGERVHGYLVPEVSGVHKFFVSGNKDVEFFINYDENGNGSPTNARDYAELTKVAEMVRGSDPDTMNYRYTSNDYDWYRWGQAPLKDVYLTAGQTYYIVAITKSVCCRDRVDKFQVAWQEPAGGAQSAAPVSGSSSNVIPGSVLVGYAVIDEKPIINLNSEDPLNHEVGIKYVDAATCTDDIDASCSVSVTDWGGMSWSNPQEGSYSLTLTTSADSGGNIAERVRTVIVLPQSPVESPAPPFTTGGITHDTWSFQSAFAKTVGQTVTKAQMYPFWSPPTGTEADEITPDSSITASDFDITRPDGFTQYYGERVHGYLVPEVTGVHKFFVSGNKDVEFFINYDENGNGSATTARDFAELTKVAEMVRGDDPVSLNYWYTSNDYDWYRWGQVPLKDVYLTAGQTYYIAAITKSVCCRTPHNKFQVAWQEPAGGAQSAAPVSGSSSNVIPGSVLAEFVIIDEPPLINLNTNPVDHVAGREYVDSATCVDDIDASCSADVTDWGGMDRLNPLPGTYALVVTAVDTAGNISNRLRTVIVYTDDAPVISLNSVNPMDHALGTEYVDLATCTDDIDASCSVSVTNWDGMDRLNPILGSYTLTLSTAPDSVGNVGTETRIVNVIFIDEAPVITLNSANPLAHASGTEYVDLATCTDDIDASCSVSVTNWGGMDRMDPQLGSYTLTLSTAPDTVGNVGTATRVVNVVFVNTDPQGLTQTSNVFASDHFLASTKSASIRQSGYLGGSAYQGPQDMYSLAAKDPANANTDSFFLSYNSFYKPSELGASPNEWNRLYTTAPLYNIELIDYQQYGVVSRFSKQGSDDFMMQETVSFKDKCESVHGMTASQNGKLVAVLCKGYLGPNELKAAVKDPFAGLPFTDLTPTGGFTDGPHLASMYILEYRDGRVTDTPDHVIRVSKAAGGWRYGNNEIDYVCDTEGGCTCDGVEGCTGGSYFVHIKVQTNNPSNKHENLYKYIVNRPTDLVSGVFNRQHASTSCGGGHPILYRKAYNSHQKAWGQTCYLDQDPLYINTLPADALGQDTSNYTSTFITGFANDRIVGNETIFTTSGGPFTLLSLGEDGYMAMLSGPGDTSKQSPKVGFYFHGIPGQGGTDELKWNIDADDMLPLGITDVGRFGYVKAAPFGHTDIATIENSERFLVGFSPEIDAAGKAKPEVFVVGEFDRTGQQIGDMVQLNGSAWGEDNNWSMMPTTGCVAFAFVGPREGQTVLTRYPVQSLMSLPSRDAGLSEDEDLQANGFTKDIQLTTICPDSGIANDDAYSLSSSAPVSVGNLMGDSLYSYDDTYSSSCPIGEVIVGMDVGYDPDQYGATIKEFRFTCAPLNNDGTAGPPSSPISYVDSIYSYGMALQNVDCPNGMLTGLRGRTDLTNIYTMGNLCTAPSQIMGVGANLDFGVPIGDSSVLDSGILSDVRCPAGHVMTGVDTYSNASYDIVGVELQCTEVLYSGSRDVVPPVITLTPETIDQRVVLNGVFTEPSVSCVDDVSGNLTVSVSEPVNVAVAGIYNPVYSCVDQAGNTTSTSDQLRTIQVEVYSPAAPVITLDTYPEPHIDFELTVAQGSTFVYPAVSCAITQGEATIEISGDEVDIDQLGSYEIIYTCSDGLGLESTETLTVSVDAALTPVFPSVSTGFTVKMVQSMFVTCGPFGLSCSTQTLDNLADAQTTINLPNPNHAAQATDVAVINYNLGGSNTGHFLGDSDFLMPEINTNFAIYATASYYVPDDAAGWYVFGTRSNDGVQLWIDGNSVITDNNSHTEEDHFGEVYLNGGMHELQLLYFQGNDSAALELFASPGRLDGSPSFSDHADFRLLSKNFFGVIAPPILTLDPVGNEHTHFRGDLYQDPIPACEGDISEIEKLGVVNPNVLGDYELVYHCIDWYGQSDTEKVTVEVVDRSEPEFDVCFLSPDEIGDGKSGLCPSDGPHTLTITESLVSENGRYSVNIYKGLSISEHTGGSTIVRHFPNPRSPATARTLTANFTDSGNFELLDRDGNILWSTGTAGSGANYIYLANDGELYMECTDGSIVWSTDSSAETVDLCDTSANVTTAKSIEMGVKNVITTNLLCQTDEDIAALCPSGKRYQLLSVENSFITLSNQSDLEYDLRVGFDEWLAGGTPEGFIRFFVDSWVTDNVANLQCLDRDSTTSFNACFINRATVDPASLTTSWPIGAVYSNELEVGADTPALIPNLDIGGEKYILNTCHRHVTNEFFLDTVADVESLAADKDAFIQRYYPKHDCLLDARIEDAVIGEVSEYRDKETQWLASGVQIAQFADEAAIFTVGSIALGGGASILLAGTELEFLLLAATAIVETGGPAVTVAMATHGIWTDFGELSSCITDVCENRVLTDMAINVITLGFEAKGAADRLGKSAVEAKAEGISKSALSLEAEAGRSGGIWEDVTLSQAQKNHYRLMTLIGLDPNIATIAKAAVASGDFRYIDALLELPEGVFKTPEFSQMLVENAESALLGETELNNATEALEELNQVLADERATSGTCPFP